ncbi:MAG: hypothetical protein KJO40_13455 [Deltaproteobacteria bacterium]|nr:hypothetical protein [Deltaproteobacteria bacterium]
MSKYLQTQELKHGRLAGLNGAVRGAWSCECPSEQPLTRRLPYPTGCCGSPEATGNSAGGLGGIAILGIAAVGLLILFPKVWDNFQKGLWGR